MSANSNKPGDMKPATATSKTPTIHAMSTRRNRSVRTRFLDVFDIACERTEHVSRSPVRLFALLVLHHPEQTKAQC